MLRASFCACTLPTVGQSTHARVNYASCVCACRIIKARLPRTYITITVKFLRLVLDGLYCSRVMSSAFALASRSRFAASLRSVVGSTTTDAGHAYGIIGLKTDVQSVGCPPSGLFSRIVEGLMIYCFVACFHCYSILANRQNLLRRCSAH
jgi:hypothetical protein